MGNINWNCSVVTSSTFNLKKHSTMMVNNTNGEIKLKKLKNLKICWNKYRLFISSRYHQYSFSPMFVVVIWWTFDWTAVSPDFDLNSIWIHCDTKNCSFGCSLSDASGKWRGNHLIKNKFHFICSMFVWEKLPFSIFSTYKPYIFSRLCGDGTPTDSALSAW